MSYEVRIVPSAEKEMNHLPPTVYARLSKRIISLQNNPRPRGVRKLSGWATTASYTLLTIESIPSPFWQQVIGAKYMVNPK